MKKPRNIEEVNMQNLTENEWRQFKIYFDFLKNSGATDEDAKNESYFKVIKTRKVGAFSSKYYIH
jgi:hypothetical protein